MLFRSYIFLSLLLSSLASIAQEVADTKIAPQSEAISEISASSSDKTLSSLEKDLKRQRKALFVLKESLFEIAAAKKAGFENKIIAAGQWIDEQLVSPDIILSPAQHIFMHAALIDCFSAFLSNAASDMPTFSPAKMLEQIKQLPIPSEQEIHALITQINVQLNELLTKLSQELHEILTGIITSQRTQLTQLQEILQLFINKINTGKFDNKAEIKLQISELRNQVQQIYNSIYQQELSPLLVKQLHRFIATVIDHIDESKNNITDLGPLTEDSVKRYQEKELDFAGISQEITQLNKRLTRIEELAEKADLSWLERTTRVLSDYVVSPLYKHRYPLLLAGASAATAGAIWYGFGFKGGSFGQWLRYYTPSWLSKPLIGDYVDVTGDNVAILNANVKKLNKRIELYGQLTAVRAEENQSSLPPAINQNPVVIEPEIVSSPRNNAIMMPPIPIDLANVPNQVKEGYFGQAQRYYVQYIHGNLPLFSLCALGLGFTVKHTWKQYHIGEKLTALVNSFKGGLYRRQALRQQHALTPVTFDDIIGMEHAKEIMDQIFNYLQNPERWDAADIKLPNVMLLRGKTRSGKTHWANAIRGEANKRLAGKINFQFREITHEEIQYNGIKAILEYAKQYWAPCILFIDELHSLHLQDTGDNKTYTEFLTALSGLDTPDPKRPVILIGATNKPENLGTPLRQKGRFGLEIRFEYPTLQERKLYMIKRLSHYAIDPMVFDIDIDKLARELEGCTYEMINGVISAAFVHIHMHGGTMSQEVLEHAIDTEIRKIIFTESQQVPEQEKKFLSAFWSGIALAAHELNLHKKISRITIRPVLTDTKEEFVGSDLWRPEEYNKKAEIMRGNIWTYHENDTFGFETNEQRIAVVKAYLAGRAAEKVIMGTTSNYWNTMRQWAFDIVKSILTQGVDFGKLSRNAQDAISDKVQDELLKYENEVEALLRSHQPTLELLTTIMQQQELLSGQEIDLILTKIKQDGIESIKSLLEAPEQKTAMNWLDMIDSLPTA